MTSVTFVGKQILSSRALKGGNQSETSAALWVQCLLCLAAVWQFFPMAVNVCIAKNYFWGTEAPQRAGTPPGGLSMPKPAFCCSTTCHACSSCIN